MLINKCGKALQLSVLRVRLPRLRFPESNLLINERLKARGRRDACLECFRFYLIKGNSDSVLCRKGNDAEKDVDRREKNEKSCFSAGEVKKIIHTREKKGGRERKIMVSFHENPHKLTVLSF